MTYQQPQAIAQLPIATMAQAAIVRVLQNPLYGTPFNHLQAQYAPSDFNLQGQPDYLSQDPGLYESGVQYVANPANPLRGVFCSAPRQPTQENSGIYYQGQFKLYTVVNLGEVFVLDGKYPKRQDAFEIFGRRYYATKPAFPCFSGEIVGAYEIELALERYPVKN